MPPRRLTHPGPVHRPVTRDPRRNGRWPGRRPRPVAVGGMAAVVQDEGLAGAVHPAHDRLDLVQGAVRVVPALHHQQRHPDPGKRLLDAPVLEFRVEPDVAPAPEGIVGPLAVMPGEPPAQRPRAESLPRGLNPLDAARLVECVRGKGHDAAERDLAGRRAEQRDGPAVAVPDEDRFRDAGRFEHPGKDRTPFAVHEVERPGQRGGTRRAVAEPAVGEDFAPGRPREYGRPVPPRSHAAEALVKQDQHRGSGFPRPPAGVLDAPARRGEETRVGHVHGVYRSTAAGGRPFRGPGLRLDPRRERRPETGGHPVRPAARKLHGLGVAGMRPSYMRRRSG